MTNIVLREHVTSVGFQLTLSKRQMEHLIWQDLLRECGYDQRKLSGPGHGDRGKPDTFIASMRSLRDRGLIEWNIMDSREDSYKRAIRRVAKKAGTELLGDQDSRAYWFQHPRNIVFTRAGRLVIDLLKEAGLYQDIAAQFTLSEVAS